MTTPARTGLLGAVLCVVGAAGIAVVVVLDARYGARGFLAEGWPRTGGSAAFRSALLALSAVVLVLSPLVTPRRPAANMDASWWLRAVVPLAVLASLLVAWLLAERPADFHRLSLEDGPVENASALALFVAAAVLLVAAAGRLPSTVLRLAVAGLGLLLALIALEEVSYFQRQLGLSTPSWLAQNRQGELNFHNLATNPVENAYYFSVFLYLVVLPYLSRLGLPGTRDLGLLVPTMPAMLIGVLACAFNFDMWNIVLTQLAFFGALAIATVFAVLARRTTDRLACLAVVLVAAAVQVTFLGHGEHLVRLWAVTEYKEALIPLALLVHALSIAGRARRAA